MKVAATRTPRVALIVGVARNGVIGRNGDLPWRLSSDLKLFRRLTMGKPIVMGRRTWASLQKKPLDGRHNIIVTRDRSFAAPGAIVVHGIEAALNEARTAAVTHGVEEIMVIGGAEIYAAALPHADRIYWTQVDAAPEGDTYFPRLRADQWQETAREPIPQGMNDLFRAELLVLDRVDDGDRRGGS